MRYIKFTYVDAVTGAPVSEVPALNGPVFPAVAGLEFGWARESQYPAAVPEFFGTCPDDSGIDVPGVFGEHTETDWIALLDDELKARQLRAIASNNGAYESAISQMTAGYPPAEIQTWERQRAEVIAWEADPNAPTPWIDLAASARGLDRGEFLARTLAKVTAFVQASAWLTGHRQGIEDAIRATSTLAALSAIIIDYTLPGGV